MTTVILLVDPLRKINSYNHGVTSDRDKNDNSNDYHFKTSYEYEPQNTNNGLDGYKGNVFQD